MNATILAKSSSGGHYEVCFSEDGERVSVSCTCAAGEKMMMCKHRFALISGDTQALYRADDARHLMNVHQWPAFANLKARVGRYDKDLRQIAVQKAELAKIVKAIKAQFSRELESGSYSP